VVEIKQPIFFVGMGRSGTTLTFAAFTAHPDLAWFSQYLARLPRVPIVAALSRVADWSPSMRAGISRSDERQRWLERLRVGPAEANTVWQQYCGKDFIYGYLRGVNATAAERRRLRRMVSSVLRYQGKPRFAAKLTGPARLEYLASIFPDARFIHVVRDGRAVVRSFMGASFLQDTWRMDEPAWRGGVGNRELPEWEGYKRSPLALAAIQWRTVVRSARQEAAEFSPTRYGEVRYEDFIADPHTALDELATFCDLRSSPAPHQFLDKRIELADMNVQWRDAFTGEELQMLNEVMGDTLEEFGYGSAPAHPRTGNGLVTIPFASRMADRIDL
jgi:omega-hydroxy-beta-dihydromenaquinone-9 sulfotransferase